MRTAYLLVAVAVILAVSFVYGTSIAEQCVSIDEYKGCWSTVDKTVTSDLCPASPCTAKPEAQQHNAVVDVLLGACQKAKNGNYENAELNKRIEEVSRTFTGSDVDFRTLCDQPGLILAKRRYE